MDVFCVNRTWCVREVAADNVKLLSQELCISELTAKLLCVRGLDEAKTARSFLTRNDDCCHDPFLMKDMDKAVARINKAIENKERVCIYGDYDVDGVTATTVLYTYLTEKGVPCSYFIPCRLEDGYGLNLRAIEQLKDTTDLIITVDTGITAVEETAYAKTLGIEMVITDHHRCREVLPDACAVVDPHREDCEYPFKALAGVGVVFKLVTALEGDVGRILERFGDIIAIGTIADVMPLIDENRYITANGIKKLKSTDNLGLRALMVCCGMLGKDSDNKKVNSGGIGFTLAPRINAAGRIRNANIAVELLLAQDSGTAEALAIQLCDINKERQETEHAIYEQAKLQLESYDGDCVYVLSSDGWHQGVIGVVASKITEKRSLPSILFSFDGDIGKGSGRSIKGFSMMEALKACDDLLIEYGGHELAAGLSVHRDNLEAFRARINQYAKSRIDQSMSCPPTIADAEAFPADITLNQAQEILKFEPFGLQNAVPLLYMTDLAVADVQPLSGGKHIRLKLRHKTSNRFFTAVFFGMRINEFDLRIGESCDIMFNLEINEFRGPPEAKMFIKYIRRSELCSDAIDGDAMNYQAAFSVDDRSDLPLSAVPTLLQFRMMFRLLKRETENGETTFSLSYLQRRFKDTENTEGLSLCAMRIILDVLEEFSLAEFRYNENKTMIDIKLLPFTGKVNLDHSSLLIRIKQNHKLV